MHIGSRMFGLLTLIEFAKCMKSVVLVFSMYGADGKIAMNLNSKLTIIFSHCAQTFRLYAIWCWFAGGKTVPNYRFKYFLGKVVIAIYLAYAISIDTKWFMAAIDKFKTQTHSNRSQFRNGTYLIVIQKSENGAKKPETGRKSETILPKHRNWHFYVFLRVFTYFC